MVTTAILEFFGRILDWCFSIVPDELGAPTWLTSAVDAFLGWIDGVTSMAVWIPLDLAVAMGALIMHVSIGGFVVKAIRILISHFTGGGGSAS